MEHRLQILIDRAEFDLVREQVQALRARIAELEKFRSTAEERRVADAEAIRRIKEEAADVNRRLDAFAESLDPDVR